MEDESLISGAQIRMARGLLGWAVAELANQSGVSTGTIKKLEKEYMVSPSVLISHNHAVRDALLGSKLIRFEENGCFYTGE